LRAPDCIDAEHYDVDGRAEGNPDGRLTRVGCCKHSSKIDSKRDEPPIDGWLSITSKDRRKT